MRKTAREVIAEVAALRGVTPEQITGRDQKQPLVHYRQEAAYEIYTQCPHLSYPHIAQWLGGRDHTTLIWSVKKHCERLGLPYSAVRRKTRVYEATTERNSRIGFIPKSPSDFRAMARL